MGGHSGDEVKDMDCLVNLRLLSFIETDSSFCHCISPTRPPRMSQLFLELFVEVFDPSLVLPDSTSSGVGFTMSLVTSILWW